MTVKGEGGNREWPESRSRRVGGPQRLGSRGNAGEWSGLSPGERFIFEPIVEPGGHFVRGSATFARFTPGRQRHVLYRHEQSAQLQVGSRAVCLHCLDSLPVGGRVFGRVDDLSVELQL